MSLKSSHWSCLKACFKGYIFCVTTFLVRPSTGAQRSHGRPPKKRSNNLERSKFRQQVQSFVCVPPWRRVTFKFWEMLKNASEVILVPKNISFLKILKFVQSFVECKGSLADGILLNYLVHSNTFQFSSKHHVRWDFGTIEFLRLWGTLSFFRPIFQEISSETRSWYCPILEGHGLPASFSHNLHTSNFCWLVLLQGLVSLADHSTPSVDTTVGVT
jgi:hypothetical protein